jgi:hypothetical protein
MQKDGRLGMELGMRVQRANGVAISLDLSQYLPSGLGQSKIQAPST